MKNNKQKFLAAATVITAAIAGIQSANAHLEPKKGEDKEKCYGVVKAGKNDCASKANKHSCSSMAKVDGDPNEWIKLPSGLCEKLVGGSTKPKEES